MSPLRHNLLSLLLVAAAVHQVGACPCGDLDHHGWYGVWRAVTGGESTTEHGGCPADHDRPAESSSNHPLSDHEGSDDAQRHGSHDPATLTQAGAFTLALFASDLAAASLFSSENKASAASGRWDSLSDRLPAPPLRARLQVLRL